MKSVLVSGGTGFIGKHLVELLLQRGFYVAVLCRDSSHAKHLLSSVHIIQGDITDPKSLEGCCASVDTVFHLAGYAHAWVEKDQNVLQKHLAINFHGVKNLLKEAIESNVKRFIYFSTVKAVGDILECMDESYDAIPNTPYGIAKRQAEALVLELGKKHQMHVCILRPTLVYGPGVKGNLMHMLRAVDKGYFPPLPEVPYYRSMVSVNDLCEAALLAAEYDRANGKIYIVSDGEDYSTRRIYNLMRKVLGKPAITWQVPYQWLKFFAYVGDLLGSLMKKRFPFDSQTLTKLLGAAHYRSKRIQDELGFQPKENFEKVLPAIVAAYQKK